MPILIARADVEPYTGPGIKAVLASPIIYSMIIPLLILDVFMVLYQNVYFGLMEIPRIDRAKYVKFDRWNLRQLSFLQRIHCAYCDYANGVVEYAKTVVNQTEVHSCVIKYSSVQKNQDFREKYYDRSRFD